MVGFEWLKSDLVDSWGTPPFHRFGRVHHSSSYVELIEAKNIWRRLGDGEARHAGERLAPGFPLYVLQHSRRQDDQPRSLNLTSQ